jgi:hypothetical protein
LWDLVIDVAGDEETRTLGLEVPEVRTEVHPKLAGEAKTAQFLALKGETLTPAAMALFLDAVIYEFSKATNLLERSSFGCSNRYFGEVGLAIKANRESASPRSCGFRISSKCF